jgi:hypothetical protein
MQHRMQHEERGKQNLQDPQSNVHCMTAFSAWRTKMLQLASMVAKDVRPVVDDATKGKEQARARRMTWWAHRQAVRGDTCERLCAEPPVGVRGSRHVA